MPTLANIQGSSLVPDISQGLNTLVSAFGTKRERDAAEAEQARQGSIQEQVGILTGGAEGDERNKALLRLTSLDPKVGSSVSGLLQNQDAAAIAEVGRQAEIGLKQAKLVGSQKDFASKQRALTSLGEAAIARGESPERIMKLQNLSEDELDLELQRMTVMGQDLSTLTKSVEQFKPITDEFGNVIAQQNVSTGKVVSDPRAKDAATPLTPIGKARADLKAGRITQSDFNTIKDTPKEFKTDVGKLIGDKQLVIETFGEGSPQAIAMEEAIASDKKGEGPKLSDVAGVRKEFTKLSSDFIGARDAFKKIQQAADNPSGPGDVAMIFSFMKTLDPTSVVREGEFATAQNSGGVPEQIRGQYNRIINGERLTPELRQEFVKTAGDLFNTQLQAQGKLEQSFTSLAESQGMNPSDVVIDFKSADDIGVVTDVALPVGVTEEDIAVTMEANNMTREQVLQRLGAQ